jgi:hypothetical protein
METLFFRFGIFYLDYAVEVENQKGARPQSLVSVL